MRSAALGSPPGQARLSRGGPRRLGGQATLTARYNSCLIAVVQGKKKTCFIITEPNFSEMNKKDGNLCFLFIGLIPPFTAEKFSYFGMTLFGQSSAAQTQSVVKCYHWAARLMSVD